MENTDLAPADDGQGNPPGEISRRTSADWGDADQIERIELLARPVCQAIRGFLQRDENKRIELRALVEEIELLQAGLEEWSGLHRRFHELMVTFAPFYAWITAACLGRESLRAAERQALLQNWRPCQHGIDTLADFARRISQIGRPFRQQGQVLRGEHWAVETVALQHVLEDILKEDNPSSAALLEAAEEFNDHCHKCLDIADHMQRLATDKVQWSHRRLLGGLL